VKHKEGVEKESVREIGTAKQIVQSLFREDPLSIILLTHSNCALLL